MNNKKVLVLGATGAMGKYLVPLLAEAGYQIDAISKDDEKSAYPNVRFLKMDAYDRPALYALLKQGKYDGIVDFMIYPTSQLPYFLPLMLDQTDHYIYLSSYRIYDDKEHPVVETSPRLIDASDDLLLRNSDDYCIYKARGENVLHYLPKKHWTILRPSITYSLMRYQLVTLEAPHTVGRAFNGKTVVLPEQARNVQATMTWGGDSAKLIAKLLFNEKALGETYTVSTAEHHTWGEIADYYKEICGLKAFWVDKEDYIRILNPDPYTPGTRWQLDYDRLFKRVINNAKILSACGMLQSDLKPLYDGLKHEISRCPKDCVWPVSQAMDAYLEEKGI
ncbi:MAG: NAD-dependent epimerase/dehydratase family protein [Lentisphaeria bacterium]